MANRKPQLVSDVRMDDKTCIVTGANSGVGFALATRLAERGANLVMVCRDDARAKAARETILASAPDATIDIVLGDLSLMHDVRDVAATLLNRVDQIDVLVNNAGVHSTRRVLTAEGNEKTWATNHLGGHLLTMLLLDRLLDSAPARIVNVSSQGHRFGGLDLNDLTWAKRHYRGLKGYGAAKTAQLLCTYLLDDLLAGTGVTINAVHPGEIKTRIGNENGTLWHLFHNNVVSRFLDEPDIAGESLYWHCADPAAIARTGRFFNLTHEEKPHPHARRDRTADWAHAVWETTCLQTGLYAEGATLSSLYARLGKSDQITLAV